METSMRPFPQTQPFHRIELTLTIANQTLPTTILDFFDVQNDFTHYVTALIPSPPHISLVSPQITLTLHIYSAPNWTKDTLEEPIDRYLGLEHPPAWLMKWVINSELYRYQPSATERITLTRLGFLRPVRPSRRHYLYSLYSDDDDVVLFPTRLEATLTRRAWLRAGANDVSDVHPHDLTSWVTTRTRQLHRTTPSAQRHS
jgi:hypothetical protein